MEFLKDEPNSCELNRTKGAFSYHNLTLLNFLLLAVTYRPKKNYDFKKLETRQRGVLHVKH